MQEAEAAYVAAHGPPLEAALSEAVNAAIAARAADPVHFISEHLEKAAVAAAELERARADARSIAATADFRELAAQGGGCDIEKTEERGITLTQLGAVRAQLERRCAAEAKSSTKEHCRSTVAGLITCLAASYSRTFSGASARVSLTGTSGG
jgi:hypothetical protein